MSQTSPSDGNSASLTTQALERIARATPQEAAGMLQFLRDLIVLSSDVYKMRAAATAYVTYCFDQHDIGSLLSLFPLLPYKEPVFSAIVAVGATVEVWPLIERMAPNPALERELVPLVCGSLRKHADSPEYARRFARLAALSPNLASLSADAFRGEAPALLAGLVGTLVHLALADDETTASRSRTCLAMAASRGLVLGDLSRVEHAIAHCSPQAREGLVTILCISRINALKKAEWTRVLQTFFADPRAEVRRGVIHALRGVSRKRMSAWPLLFHAVNDPDASVRNLAIETAKAGARVHARWLPRDTDVRALLSSVTESSGDDVLRYLLFVAAQAPTLAQGWMPFLGTSQTSRVVSSLRQAIARQAEQRPSRACAQCNSLGNAITWNSDLVAPRAFARLEKPKHGASDGLRRCRSCATYFVYTYDCEYDVNSQHESMTLQRLTKQEAVGRFSDLVEPDHPRWAEWEAALVDDLDHLDPGVRARAAWEIAKDACRDKAFDRVESVLLRHSSSEVMAEGLHALVAACGISACPVRRETLIALSRHSDPVVQRNAAYLLVAHAATDRNRPLDWSFASGPACEGQAAAVSRLVDAGMQLSPAAAVPLLESALQSVGSARYVLHALLAEHVLAGAQAEACFDLLLRALTSAETLVRGNAFDLAQRVPERLLAQTGCLQRVVAARALEPTKVVDLSLRMVQAGARLDLAEALVAQALVQDDRHLNQRAVQALDAALSRGESCSALFAPLCALCDRERNAYSAMALVRRWAAAQAVPQDCLSVLSGIVDTGVGSFHDDCVHAVMSMHLRANDEQSVLSLLNHRLASVRGIAASHFAAARVVVSPLIHERLTDMAARDEAYPSAEAKRALASVGPVASVAR